MRIFSFDASSYDFSDHYDADFAYSCSCSDFSFDVTFSLSFGGAFDAFFDASWTDDVDGLESHCYCRHLSPWY